MSRRRTSQNGTKLFLCGYMFFCAPPKLALCDTIHWPSKSSRATITAAWSNGTVAVGSSSRVAGAIDSLVWNGFEFINDFDHGRELQSDLRLDDFGGCANPTEAGSAADGTGPDSSSQLRELVVMNNRLTTVTQMAPWFTSETSARCPRLPPIQQASTLTKIVSFDKITENVIHFEINFKLPIGHSSVTFEILTAYLDARIGDFFVYNPKKNSFRLLRNWTGEQGLPVVVTDKERTHAFALVSVARPENLSTDQPTYGTFDFSNFRPPNGATNKINVVTRSKNVPPGEYAFHCLAIVGDFDTVSARLSELRDRILYLQ